MTPPDADTLNPLSPCRATIRHRSTGRGQQPERVRSLRSTRATLFTMRTVGLRELRHHAADLVRRVEAGEEITITVAGRPSARLVAVAPQRWRSFDAIAELFHGPENTEREADRHRIDDGVRDPWTAT